MNADIMQSLLTGGISSSIIAILYVAYKLCKKSRCRSSCCGYSIETDVSLGSNSSNDKPFIV